jgi:hypothetical protein
VNFQCLLSLFFSVPRANVCHDLALISGICSMIGPEMSSKTGRKFAGGLLEKRFFSLLEIFFSSF